MFWGTLPLVKIMVCMAEEATWKVAYPGYFQKRVIIIMARRKKASPAALFNQTVRSALEQVEAVTQLGESPLATPYFLGNYLPADLSKVNQQLCGETLQQLLYETWQALWPGVLPDETAGLITAVNEVRQQMGNKGEQYAFFILELRYFRRYLSPQQCGTTSLQIASYLNISQARFFVHLDVAIGLLAEKLLDRIGPMCRLERPHIPTDLVGRSTILQTCLHDLQAGHSVALTGMGGVGKTSVGATIGAVWPTTAVFWYTFRPQLNDNLTNLLFALGHFLQQQGQTMLWLQLLTDKGQLTNMEQLLGLLRSDLHQLNHLSPLFCFDEMDMLQVALDEPQSPSHTQVLAFLDMFKGLASTLYIGQRVPIDTVKHYSVLPLNKKQMTRLLQQAGIELPSRKLRQLHTYTGGVPRLLELVILLLQSGEDLNVLLNLHKQAAAHPLFHRLWKRLDRMQKDVLYRLAVFRTAVPSNIWNKAQRQAIRHLRQRHLIQRDETTGLALLPFIRALIYNMMHAEQRDEQHLRAAQLRAQHGNYTAAAYHFVVAGEYETAVNSWFPHMETEIAYGQGRAAYDIFQTVSPRRLEEKVRKTLLLIQNRLFLLSGEAEQVLSNLQQHEAELDDHIGAKLLYQWGEAHNILNQAEAALKQYEESIAVLGHIAYDTVQNYYRRSQLLYRQRDITAAHHEADRADFVVQELRGFLQFISGDYPAAQVQFTTALNTAIQTNDTAQQVTAQRWLAMLAGKAGDMATAEGYANAVMKYYEKTGDRYRLEDMRATLAGMYLNVRQFEAVIAPSERALRYFEQIKYERRIAGICNNLAEAYLELGRMDKAKDYVFRVIRLENVLSLPYAHYTLGLIHQREANLHLAQTVFQEGIQIAQGNNDQFIEAYLQRALGQLLLTLPDLVAAETALQTALTLFTRMEIGHEMAVTQELLATVTHT